MIICAHLDERGGGMGDEKINTTEQIDNFVRLNGGNERDALNVALARLDRAEAAEARAAQNDALMTEAATLIAELRAERDNLRARLDAAQAEILDCYSEREEAQPISREHAAMIDALQGELNKALARIAELETRDAERNKTIIALCDERDGLRRQLETVQKLAPALLKQLKDDIDAIGDDHSVGVCNCGVVWLADSVKEIMDSAS